MEKQLSGEPLSGLRLPTGEITTGDRPDRTLRKRNARIARAFNLAGKRVLDIGCAEGLHSLYMSESAKEVLGIDHRASVINRAEANRQLLGITNVTFKRGDVRDRELFEGIDRFDLVVAWGLLHRVSDVFSLLQSVGPVAEALSLEWRTPVLPFMSRLSLAYHPPVGEALDPMNLESRDGKGSISDSDKIEGHTGFWEPTPGAVRTICRRLGFRHARLFGYGEDLKSETRTVVRSWAGQAARAVTRRAIIHQVPLSRVHMLFEREPGGIDLCDPFGADLRLPDWEQAVRL